MVIEFGKSRRLGVPAPEARLRFEAEPRVVGGGPGRRLLVVDGESAFELSFWCGTCPLLFRRLETATQKLSLESVRERLTGALAGPDEGGVVDASAHLYEFVVPMVPPTWNTRERVEEYAELMGRGTVPTAVAISTTVLPALLSSCT